MTPVSSETLHASCVAIDGHAVLIEGPPGAGKSDLALRLIDRGAVLVSDDYTILVRRAKKLFATAPVTIAGRMEVRGLGIIDFPCIDEAAVALIVSLTADVARMPLDQPARRIVGIDVPMLALDPFPASAPIKVEIALRERGTLA